MGLRLRFSFLGVLGAWAQIPFSPPNPLLFSDLVVGAGGARSPEGLARLGPRTPGAWHAWGLRGSCTPRSSCGQCRPLGFHTHLCSGLRLLAPFSRREPLYFPLG